MLGASNQNFYALEERRLWIVGMRVRRESRTDIGLGDLGTLSGFKPFGALLVSPQQVAIRVNKPAV
jgi:hypothetical protein